MNAKGAPKTLVANCNAAPPVTLYAPFAHNPAISFALAHPETSSTVCFVTAGICGEAFSFRCLEIVGAGAGLGLSWLVLVRPPPLAFPLLWAGAFVTLGAGAFVTVLAVVIAAPFFELAGLLLVELFRLVFTLPVFLLLPFLLVLTLCIGVWRRCPLGST